MLHLLARPHAQEHVFPLSAIHELTSSVQEEVEEELQDIENERGRAAVAPESEPAADEVAHGRETLVSKTPEQPAGMTSQQQFSLLVKAFTLTFVAEWGDRSQIATIALAADKNPFGVVRCSLTRLTSQWLSNDHCLC